MNKIIKKVTFCSLNSGPHLLVLGAVHGNEYCGPIAINRVLDQFESGEHELCKGSVTFVPICNPKAYELKQREVERNLNRHLYPKPDKNDYEDYIDPILCPELEKADYLLDLHSYQSQGSAFIFLSGTDKVEEQFARSLGVDQFVFGWNEAFNKIEKPTQEAINAAMGTTGYARQFGAKAVTLECGHHHNVDSADIGQRGIIKALQHLSLTEGESRPPSKSHQHCVRMKEVFYKDKAGEWAQSWQHFDRVNAGDCLIRYDDGTSVSAEQSGYLILPKSFAQEGEEWIYFGIGDDFPSETHKKLSQ